MERSRRAPPPPPATHQQPALLRPRRSMFGLSGAEFAAAERSAERALAAADAHMAAAEAAIAAAQWRRCVAPLAPGEAPLGLPKPGEDWRDVWRSAAPPRAATPPPVVPVAGVNAGVAQHVCMHAQPLRVHTRRLPRVQRQMAAAATRTAPATGASRRAALLLTPSAPQHLAPPPLRRCPAQQLPPQLTQLSRRAWLPWSGATLPPQRRTLPQQHACARQSCVARTQRLRATPLWRATRWLQPPRATDRVRAARRGRATRRLAAEADARLWTSSLVWLLLFNGPCAPAVAGAASRFIADRVRFAPAAKAVLLCAAGGGCSRSVRGLRPGGSVSLPARAARCCVRRARRRTAAAAPRAARRALRRPPVFVVVPHFVVSAGTRHEARRLPVNEICPRGRPSSVRSPRGLARVVWLRCAVSRADSEESR